MPGVDISGFSTRAGIPLLTEAEESESDIWILVDGKIRFQKNDVHCGQMFDVRFAIAPEERFFTLVATDSQSGPPDYWSLLDWCYFSQPTLLLTPAGRDPGTD
jgi:hypothetical protein